MLLFSRSRTMEIGGNPFAAWGPQQRPCWPFWATGNRFLALGTRDGGPPGPVQAGGTLVPCLLPACVVPAAALAWSGLAVRPSSPAAAASASGHDWRCCLGLGSPPIQHFLCFLLRAHPPVRNIGPAPNERRTIQRWELLAVYLQQFSCLFASPVYVIAAAAILLDPPTTSKRGRLRSPD